MKSSVAVDYRVCCCFLGNIPETEDGNLRKPLKHTILILHSTLSTSFHFWGGCAHTTTECIHIMTIIHWAEWRKKMKNSSGNYVCQSEKPNDWDMKGSIFFTSKFCLYNTHAYTDDGCCWCSYSLLTCFVWLTLLNKAQSTIYCSVWAKVRRTSHLSGIR